MKRRNALASAIYPSATESDRAGSTLIIVLALLGLLSLLAFVFYTFAAQERSSAEYYAEAGPPESVPSDVLDFMIKQLIVGPETEQRNSVLRGWSIVKDVYGGDRQDAGLRPYSDTGVNIRLNGNFVEVDNDFDNVADVNTPLYNPIDLVHSGAVRGGEIRDLRRFPGTAVEYTYPDHNNPWIAYRGHALEDTNPAVSPTPRELFIPSWFRPGLFRTDSATGLDPLDTNENVGWFGSNSYAARSFRPHRDHVVVDGQNNNILRFIPEAEATSLALENLTGFPLVPPNMTLAADTASDARWVGADDTKRGEMGFFTNSDPRVWELDVDNDLDGKTEGIYLDLDYPVQERTDGVLYTAIHSMTVYCLDSLLSLGIHGNLEGFVNLETPANAALPAYIFGGTVPGSVPLLPAFISASNAGASPSEINPEWGFTRDPNVDAVDQQYEYFYHAPPGTIVEAANMDWFWLNVGRAELNRAVGATPLDGDEVIHAGRYGETDQLYDALNDGGRALTRFPQPGQAGQDENSDNRLEGQYVPGLQRPFGHPADFTGGGTLSLPGNPRQISFNRIDPLSPVQWPVYTGYHLRANPSAAGSPNGHTDLNGVLYPGQLYEFGSVVGVGTLAAPAVDDLRVQPPIAGPAVTTYQGVNSLFDDAMELVVEPRNVQPPYDRPFGPEDLPYLHLGTFNSAAFRDEKLTEKRLEDLALFNLADDQAEIRERFTTASWDRKQFRLPFSGARRIGAGGGLTEPFRDWEFNADSDRDSNASAATNGTSYRGREFPPVFGSTQPFGQFDPFRPQIRRLMRTEIGNRRERLQQLPLSLNGFLDVERTGAAQENYVDPINGRLEYRQLTEHPDAELVPGVLATTAIPNAVAVLPSFPPVTTEDREFWARRDRQQLARDIYVLLYTIGGVEQFDAAGQMKDYTQTNDPYNVITPGNADDLLYTPAQLRMMAQFAVNLVDAMDRDSVITKFEYDKNLGDTNGSTRGWSLDDDASTVEAEPFPGAVTSEELSEGGLYSVNEETTERGVVYGQEAQQLVFNETLAIATPHFPGTDNTLVTDWDDELASHFYLFLELLNVTPSAVDLSTPDTVAGAATGAPNAGIWRIKRIDHNNVLGNSELVFLRDAGVIPGGGTYTISSSDNGFISPSDPNDPAIENRSSDFRVHVDNSGTPTLIVPDVTGPDPNQAYCNLDLILHDPTNPNFGTNSPPVSDVRFEFGPASVNRGHMLYFDHSLGMPPQFTLVLERRMNPNMPQLPVSQNPWIEVDRVHPDFTSPSANNDWLMSSDTPAVMSSADRIPSIHSFERSEPLDNSASIAPSASTNLAIREHSIGAAEVARPPAAYTNWQPHFDRDFVSIGELLHVPLYGPLAQDNGTFEVTPTATTTYSNALYSLPAPDQRFGPTLTNRFGNSLQPADAQIVNAKTARPYGAADMAMAMFLAPDGGSMADITDDNRWYRLFEFLDVPTRTHKQIGNPLNQVRVPGKLNLNMIRHPEVLAGLLDEQELLQYQFPVPANGPRLFLDDRIENAGGVNPTARDWWVQFLRARDGQFIVRDGGVDRIYLVPGVPGSRPFRALSYVRPNAQQLPAAVDDRNLSIEHTVLRDLPADPAATARHLFEVGTAANHTGATVHPVLRDRLLSKVLNNTTEFSNVLIVFASADWFEVYQDPGTGANRIGGQINPDPDDMTTDPTEVDMRAIYILDRSRADEAYDQRTGRFDWRQMVLEKLILKGDEDGELSRF